jgi:3-hydroxyethyl bacteriochlorophyllide a dehydrogenase
MSYKVASLQSDQAQVPPNIVGPALESELIAKAIIFNGDSNVSVADLDLRDPEKDDMIIDVIWSGVSTGTERLLWSSQMPPFPGLSYPLVPGYEAVGLVVAAPGQESRIGEPVFIPGAQCFKDVSGLFGGSASRLIAPASRAVSLAGEAKAEDVLLALAATAHHAVMKSALPELIIGHGTLGRLMARIVLALGADDITVWETDADRAKSETYRVLHPDEDIRQDYQSICDASGSIQALDQAVTCAGRGADIVLAGFYAERVSFDFPAAFMRELTFKIAAEWTPEDIVAVQALRAKGLLSFDGLITHVRAADDAQDAYQTAFTKPECLKMVLDWRASS